MAVNTMEKLYLSLRDLTPQIELDEGVRVAGKRSLDRMLSMEAGTVGQGDVGAMIPEMLSRRYLLHPGE